MKKIIILASVLATLSFAEDNFTDTLQDKQLVGDTIFDINVNDEDLNLGVKYDISKINKNFKKHMSYAGIRYLKQEHGGSLSDLLEFNFILKDFIKTVPGLKMGVGAKLIYTSYENSVVDQDFTAVPLGAELEYFLPGHISSIPISIDLGAYYAPMPLTFSGETYSELTGKINVRILEHTNVYVGYRDINVDFGITDVSSKYNESWFAGVSFSF